MGIKKFLKSLFGMDENENFQENDPKQEIKSKEWDTRICIYCQKEIGVEKKRYANGKLFHKKCFKRAESNFRNGKAITS